MEHLREEIEEEEEEVEGTTKDDNMFRELNRVRARFNSSFIQLFKESWNRRSRATCKTYFKRSSKNKKSWKKVS